MALIKEMLSMDEMELKKSLLQKEGIPFITVPSVFDKYQITGNDKSKFIIVKTLKEQKTICSVRVDTYPFVILTELKKIIKGTS